MKIQLICITALSLGSMMAFAADPVTPGAPASHQISFEELKARCQHPEQFDVQRAPQNIRIQCAEQRRQFVAAPAGEFPLPSDRKISTAVLADKFYVTMEERSIPVTVAQGNCLRFKEVQDVITLERTLGCEEVLGIKKDIQEFCIPALDAAKAANPKLSIVTETGKVMDTCGKTID